METVAFEMGFFGKCVEIMRDILGIGIAGRRKWVDLESGHVSSLFREWGVIQFVHTLNII